LAPINRIYITDLFMISGKIHYAKSSGTVKGTFDDLSDDEKTKAFLQLLEYKIRLEQEQKQEEEREQDNFHELWQKLPSHQVKPESETEEEKKVRESIQVWYGINSSTCLHHNLKHFILLIFFYLIFLID